MKTVKYSGPHRPGVELVVGGRPRTVEYLHETELPDHVADELVAGDPDSWSLVARGEQLRELTVKQLQQIADRDSIAIEGTGQDGRVLKDDLIAAIEKHRAAPPAAPDNDDMTGDGAGEGGES